MNSQNIPLETLQRLIDYAHAAMVKRPDTPDEYPMNSSRKPDGKSASILAKDLRVLQRIAPPSWEKE